MGERKNNVERKGEVRRDVEQRIKVFIFVFGFVEFFLGGGGGGRR